MHMNTVVLHDESGVKCIYVWDGVNVQQFRDGVHGEGVRFPLVSLLFRGVCDP